MRSPPPSQILRALRILNRPITAISVAATVATTSYFLSRPTTGSSPGGQAQPHNFMPNIPFFSSFFSSSSSDPKKMTSYPDQRSPEEWRAVLSPEQFRVLRMKGTEPPSTGIYDKHYPAHGVYTCAGCNAPLYKAAHKFSSGCGWPAYFDSIPGAVTRHEDRTFGMMRTEIVCSNCGGHLGHVFKGEGFPTPTDERHCVNSVSLTFREKDPAEGQQGGQQEAQKDGEPKE